jgi:hypothetical protein
MRSLESYIGISFSFTESAIASHPLNVRTYLPAAYCCYISFNHASQRKIHGPQAPRRSQGGDPQRRQRWCAGPMVCKESADDGARVSAPYHYYLLFYLRTNMQSPDTKSAAAATIPTSRSKTSRRSTYLSGPRRNGRRRKGLGTLRKTMGLRRGICLRRLGRR